MFPSSNFYMFVPSPNGQSQGARELVEHKCTPRISVHKFFVHLALSLQEYAVRLYQGSLKVPKNEFFIKLIFEV